MEPRETLDVALEVGLEAAWLAGRKTLSYFQAGVEVETKDDASPVTVADRESELLMRNLIASRFPKDGILGEEFGVERADAPRRWILDPIDGTRAFVHGVPLYGVLVALEERGVVQLGIAHFPALGETVWAARGRGCFWNGRRARVSEVSKLSDALVCTSDAEQMITEGKGDRWDALRREAKEVRTWGDAYGYALVATGRAEAMLDGSFALWDAAAVRPIIEEAGGVFTDWDGVATHGSGNGIGTNAAVAEELRRVLGAKEAP